MNPTKQCTKCGIEYLATLEFFTRDKHKRDGLTSSCKSCRRTASQVYRAENPEKVRASFSKYYAKNAEWMRERVQIYRTENPDKVRASSRKHYQENRDSELERNREYREKNPDKIKEYNHNYRVENLEQEHERGRKYYAENAEKIAEKNRLYREQNPEKIRLLNQEWQSQNLDKLVIIAQRRRTRKRALPNTLTTGEWAKAVEYWNNHCAYCGKEDEKLSVDHYIPLSHPECPGTIAHNIIPACMTCNRSKKNRDPIKWMTWKFGFVWANEIQERITIFFDSIIQYP